MRVWLQIGFLLVVVSGCRNRPGTDTAKVKQSGNARASLDTLEGAGWRISADTTGAAHDTITLHASRGARPIVTGSVRAAEPPTLALSCTNGRFSAMLQMTGDVSFANSATVRYSLDGAPDQTETWHTTYEGISVYPDDQLAFVRKLIGHDTLRIERDMPGGSIAGAVALDGLTARLGEMQSRCNDLKSLSTP